VERQGGKEVIVKRGERKGRGGKRGSEVEVSPHPPL